MLAFISEHRDYIQGFLRGVQFTLVCVVLVGFYRMRNILNGP